MAVRFLRTLRGGTKRVLYSPPSLFALGTDQLAAIIHQMKQIHRVVKIGRAHV